MGLVFSRIKPENWNPRRPGHLPENVETLADYELPINTTEILQRKLSRYAARFCLHPERELHIESLFFAHVSKPVGSTDAYWSEEDLLRFYSTIPHSSFPKLPLSCSVLYKLLLRLGSFPYITQSAPYLTYDVFRLGIIMLSGRYIERSAADTDPDKNENPRFISRRYRQMVFQALAERSCNEKSSYASESRSDSDDEDLSDALVFLKNAQQWDGPDPCIGFDAAPLPALSSLPSSMSTHLDGKVAWDEIMDFLETLLVLKIWDIGIRVDYTSNSTPDLHQALDSIIAAIDGSMPGKTGKEIDWSTFNTLLDTLIPRALEALPRIVDLFFTPLDERRVSERGGSSTVQNGYQYPKSLEEFIPSLKGKTALLSLPILSQILCCINFEAGASHIYRLRKASFVFSGDLAGLLAAAPKFEDVQGPKEFALLLSGISSESEREGAPQEILYAVVCLDDCRDPYMVGNAELAPFGTIIQLEPTLRQFPASRPLSPSTPTLLPRMEFGKDTRNPIEIKVKNGPNNWAELALEQVVSTNAKISWAWGEQERREESFKLKTIELIVFRHH